MSNSEKLSKMIYVSVDTIRGACGVQHICHFGWGDLRISKNLPTYAGSGWSTAGFIDTYECRKVYEFLKARYPIVYQTPVRYNKNSGNRFFFAVFDTSKNRHIDD